MNIHEKLMAIQSSLKAPKGQYNEFGKYKYRNLEDIAEAVKPLLLGARATLIMSDELVIIGDRFYIKATATITDVEDPAQNISNTAYARESLTKKGMDDSQITGATSSYARKYCLNGLFCIDDNEGIDSMPPAEVPKKTLTMSQSNIQWLTQFCKKKGMTDEDKAGFKKDYAFDPYQTTDQQFEAIKQKIEADYGNS